MRLYQKKASLLPCCQECLWAGALGRVPAGETKLTAAAVLGGCSAAQEGKKGEICTPSMYLGQFVGIGVVAAAREVVKGNVKEVC